MLQFASRFTLFALAFCLAMPALSLAEDAPNTAASAQADLRTRTLEAYKNITTSQADIELTINASQGEQQVNKNYQFKMAIDKPADSLSFTALDMVLVIADAKLQFKAKQIPDRYLSIPAQGDLDYQMIARTLPFMTGPMAAIQDLPLYLGEAIIPENAQVLPADEQGRPGLSYTNDQGPITLRLDPKTHLIATITREFSTPQSSATLTWTNNIHNVGQDIAGSTFTFDPGQAQPVQTIQALVGQREQPSLKGKDAPAFSVNDIQGQEVSLQGLQDKHKVVILDFWASWCGPCMISLPNLQKVYTWVADEKLPVGIYTVNVQETPEQAKPVWEKLKLNLPILMDAQGKVSEDYMAYGIPYMVVIHQGKVKQIHVGASPTLEADLKNEITTLLKGE